MAAFTKAVLCIGVCFLVLQRPFARASPYRSASKTDQSIIIEEDITSETTTSTQFAAILKPVKSVIQTNKALENALKNANERSTSDGQSAMRGICSIIKEFRELLKSTKGKTDATNNLLEIAKANTEIEAEYVEGMLRQIATSAAAIEEESSNLIDEVTQEHPETLLEWKNYAFKYLQAYEADLKKDAEKFKMITSYLTRLVKKGISTLRSAEAKSTISNENPQHNKYQMTAIGRAMGVDKIYRDECFEEEKTASRERNAEAERNV